MKRVCFISLVMVFIVGCGTEQETIETSYDMWQYMTPSIDYEVEYDVYENGKRTDYMIETIKIIRDGVVQQENSQEGIRVLRRESQNIVVSESGNDTALIQRYVQAGDQNVINSPTLGSCRVEAYHRSITLRTYEFYNVVQINCLYAANVTHYYYAFDEGLVGFYMHDGTGEEELVKVDERKL